MPKIIDQNFKPAHGLRSAHLQTFLASNGLRTWLIKRRYQAILETSESLIVTTSDGSRLEGHWSPHPQARAVVVLLPGWEGCHESTYLFALAARLYADGYSVFRLNTRDHGDTYHLNQGAFHTWRLQEIIDGVTFASTELANGLPTFLAAFSMGGNLALRSLAQDSMQLVHTFTFNAPIRPHNVLDALDNSPYRSYFVKNWQQSLKAKQAAFPEHYDFAPISKMHTVSELCEYVLQSGYGPCDNLQEYLNGYTFTGEQLQQLQGSATIVTAKDDPIIPVSDYTDLPDSAQAKIIITEYGGHCGFISSPNEPSYIYQLVKKEIESILEADSEIAA